MHRAILAVFVVLGLATAGTPARADGCYICTSGSACQQCRYGSKDTQAERKKCRDAGCTIGGTRSCSTAANIRTCRASLDAPGWRFAEIEGLPLAAPAAR